MNRLLNLSYLSIIIAIVAISPANASTLQQDLESCGALKDNSKRLDCFDLLVKKPQPKIVVIEEKELFGFESKQSLLTPEELLVTVVKVKKGVRGKLTFTLANGQVWKQSNNERFKLKADAQVYIKKAALGSFFLGQVDRNKRTRIKRIK